MYIAESAYIGEEFAHGRGIYIGERADIGDFGYLGTNSTVGDGTRIEADFWIGPNVTIGPNVIIGAKALILNGAKICPNPVKSVSSDGRELGSWITVGKKVLLHDEVELGDCAMVPTQRTIATIGNLGAKNRVVTIYGSQDGPLFCVGCCIGFSYDEIVKDINKDTSKSAATYRPYLDVFNQIGKIVQTAFDKEAKLVDELLTQHLELFN